MGKLDDLVGHGVLAVRNFHQDIRFSNPLDQDVATVVHLYLAALRIIKFNECQIGFARNLKLPLLTTVCRVFYRYSSERVKEYEYLYDCLIVAALQYNMARCVFVEICGFCKVNRTLTGGLGEQIFP